MFLNLVKTLKKGRRLTFRLWAAAVWERFFLILKPLEPRIKTNLFDDDCDYIQQSITLFLASHIAMRDENS